MKKNDKASKTDKGDLEQKTRVKWKNKRDGSI